MDFEREPFDVFDSLAALGIARNIQGEGKR
jgi:hypothetical protein